MSYIAHSADQIESLLEAIGLTSTQDLFSHIPSDLLLKTDAELNPPLSEAQLTHEAVQLANENFNGVSFAGFGLYQHYIPVVVNHLATLRQFETAYTPYQSEVAQGILQALFEYQSLMASLTSMDIANASLYDGATAMVEAIRMAIRQSPKKNEPNEPIVVAISSCVHHHYLAVARAYFSPRVLKELNLKLHYLPVNKQTGETIWDIATADVFVYQSPNVFGVVETAARNLPKDHPQAQILYGTNEPMSLTILPPPDESGAHIVWGEGQSLGSTISFGGPSLGFIAAKEKYIRQMPGRLVGRTTAKTTHNESCDAYVITLSTREQHIRREKATSNICSNQTLVAIRAAITMAAMGWGGMQQCIARCVANAEYFKNKLTALAPETVVFSQASFFHEVTLKSKHVDTLYQQAMAHGICPGVVIDNDTMVSYFNENTEQSKIDELVEMICRLKNG